MVFYGDSVTALGVKRANFVLDFLEATFDLPACGVEFDHLFSGKRQVGADQRETEAFAVNEHYLDPAFQCPGHADKFGKGNFAFFAVEMDFSGTGLTSQLSGKSPDRSKTLTVRPRLPRTITGGAYSAAVTRRRLSI